MANKFVTAIFGDYSKKEVKRVKKTADKVRALEDKYAAMSFVGTSQKCERIRRGT